MAQKTGLLVIDPGHGGVDPGAVDGGLQEKSIVLRLAGLVNHWALHNDIRTLLTRTSDRFISLKRRTAIERQAVSEHDGPTAFVSLHVNAAASGSSARGVSVFHHELSRRGPDLAAAIFDAVRDRAPEMPQYNAGVLADEADGILNDESFLDHALYVLKHTRSPAALVELGFITNPADRDLLVTPQFLDAAALGIVDGVQRWFAERR